MELKHWEILRYAPNIKSEFDLGIIKKANQSKSRLALFNSIIEKSPAPFRSFSSFSDKTAIKMFFTIFESTNTISYGYEIELVFRHQENGVWLLGRGRSEFLKNPSAEDIVAQMKVLIDGQ